jgi:23S rRNA pseudouridine2605 synthase
MNDTLSLKGDRIAKVIARAGICSRREAEKLIEAGRVTVDGEIIKSPALNVTPLNKIIVDGVGLPQKQPPRLWKLHKDRGYITSNKDPEGRPTIFDDLPKELPRVISVGRLDFNTEGLLLLTNDGELARYLERPDAGFKRTYRVRVHGRVIENSLAKLKDGITIDGIQYGEIDAALDVQKGSNAWVTIAIREGKNREVRRIMEYLGLDVTRLLRTDYGPVQLGQLPKGQVEEIPHRLLVQWFGGKVPGITAPKTSAADRVGFAKAKPKAAFKGPRKDIFEDKDKKGKKPHADRRR